MSKNINSNKKNQPGEVTAEAEHGIGANPGIRDQYGQFMGR